VTTPFRWNLARRESLGRLITGERAPSYRELHGDLLACIARIIAQAQEAELLFIGRSPESIFDLMSGLLAETGWAPRLGLLNLSLRSLTAEALRTMPQRRGALRALLDDVGLSPIELVRRARPVAFVDLVYEGLTFTTLAESLLDWAKDQHVDARAFTGRVRFIGITEQTKTSPKTWRWQQHARFAQWFPPRAIRNVSIPARLWRYLGNTQPKVSVSSPPDTWRDPKLRIPPREKEHLAALRLAWDLYTLGTERATRLNLARRLSRTDRMDARWLRALILELKSQRRP
jgi:hypothetical protein